MKLSGVSSGDQTRLMALLQHTSTTLRGPPSCIAELIAVMTALGLVSTDILLCNPEYKPGSAMGYSEEGIRRNILKEKNDTNITAETGIVNWEP